MLCLFYLYYAILAENFNDFLLILSVVSLGLEGIIVFGFNHGECPLIFVQKRVKDEKPFFELIFSPSLAKKAIPFFAILTLIAVFLFVLKYLVILV